MVGNNDKLIKIMLVSYKNMGLSTKTPTHINNFKLYYV